MPTIQAPRKLPCMKLNQYNQVMELTSIPAHGEKCHWNCSRNGQSHSLREGKEKGGGGGDEGKGGQVKRKKEGW